MNNDFNGEKGLPNATKPHDINTFESLFITFYPKIERFLTGFLDSKSEAEDLAQDVFVKVWQNRSTLVYVENLNAYFYRIAKNTLFDHINKSRELSYTRTPILPEIATTEAIEELLFADELNDLINVAIDNMPPQRKTIFKLSRVEGLSNDEIAQQLGISKRTVETHISAALSDIRKVLPILLLFF